MPPRHRCAANQVLGLILSALRSRIDDRHVSSAFDDEEPTDVVIRPWTPVHSVRGKFVHMAYDGKHTLCNVRLRTIVAAPDSKVDCYECWCALTYN